MTWADELKKALAYESGELVDPADTDHQELFMAAARAVLDGRDVYWCEEHGSAAANITPGFPSCEWSELNPDLTQLPCRMKQVRIIDIPEEGQ